MPDVIALGEDDLVTNLQGQRLGRKGRDTRERIVEAARQLLAQPLERPLSLSAVAREASLGMSSIYNYFADMTELILAVLDPIMASSEEAYVHLIRERWPDDVLYERCRTFVHGFHAFWREHSRVLHLRNQMADQHDIKMMQHRIDMARPVIRLLGEQMDTPPGQPSREFDLASVLFTGLERVVTIATDDRLKAAFPPHLKPRFDGSTLEQQARLLALAIADGRAAQQR